MTTRDIQQIVKELYGVDVSPTLVSEITASLDSEVKAWQTQRLDAVYVSTTDSKEVVADLKKVYQADSAIEAEHELESFAAKWDAKYPTIAR